jgi:hypothetical protein
MEARGGRVKADIAVDFPILKELPDKTLIGDLFNKSPLGKNIIDTHTVPGLSWTSFFAVCEKI